MSDESVRSFRIDVPKVEVERLLHKLRDTRLPTSEIVPDAGDEYGVSLPWIKEMYDYWLHDYSWDHQQEYINQWPHFLADINSQTIHFIHARSHSPNAVPVLLIHGWPGSFYEFNQVINPLTNFDNPKQQQAFHCIVPSLPGFCFSSRPPRGQTLKQVAGMFHVLMTEKLGYGSYFVQAGDWGHWVARELGANPKYSPHVLGIHFNWLPAPLPPLAESTNERDQKIHARVQSWLTSHLAYAIFMRTRPSGLGVMLIDNPTAHLSFIGEKYVEMCNPSNPLIRTNLWKDHILTTICLYYFTRCADTASLVYFENVRHEQFPVEIVKPENRITVPMGYTSYLWDTRPSLKSGVEQTGNLVWFKERDEAGHFAALECPEGFVEDLREVVGLVVRGEVKREEEPV